MASEDQTIKRETEAVSNEAEKITNEDQKMEGIKEAVSDGEKMSSEDEKGSGNTAVIDVADFFPKVNDDVSRVTWAHAVNSADKLKDALEDDEIMMLEGDILGGHLEVKGVKSDDIIPIMAHPPNKQSDLSFATWIMGIIEANKAGKKKGAKLDFKDMSIVKESLVMLHKHTEDITFPLWLNADILKGPVETSNEPLDKVEFISLCEQYFPQATLSVGWVTKYSPDSELNEYTKDMVVEMATVLEAANIAQPVTFPIRASFVNRSLEALDWLADNVVDSTLTIFSPESELFDPLSIITLQDSLGLDCVYLDLPEEGLKAVDEARVREIATEDGGFRILPHASALVASAGMALAAALAALYLYE